MTLPPILAPSHPSQRNCSSVRAYTEKHIGWEEPILDRVKKLLRPFNVLICLSFKNYLKIDQTMRGKFNVDIRF